MCVFVWTKLPPHEKSDAIVFVMAILRKFVKILLGLQRKFKDKAKENEKTATTKHIKPVWKINILKIRQLLANQPLLLTNIQFVAN